MLVEMIIEMVFKACHLLALLKVFLQLPVEVTGGCSWEDDHPEHPCKWEGSFTDAFQEWLLPL